MNDGRLTPSSIEPDVPGDMPRGSEHGAIAVDRVKSIIERVIDLGLDDPAANPQPGCARLAIRLLREGSDHDAARNLVRFEPRLPRFARI